MFSSDGVSSSRLVSTVSLVFRGPWPRRAIPRESPGAKHSTSPDGGSPAAPQCGSGTGCESKIVGRGVQNPAFSGYDHTSRVCGCELGAIALFEDVMVGSHVHQLLMAGASLLNSWPRVKIMAGGGVQTNPKHAFVFYGSRKQGAKPNRLQQTGELLICAMVKTPSLEPYGLFNIPRRVKRKCDLVAFLHSHEGRG